MIAFLIALLLTISTGGNVCDLGQPVEWYSWEDANPSAKLVFTLSASADNPDIWIYKSADQYVMFVFKDPIGETSGAKHGACSRDVSP